jgi:hypothetical protein
MLNYVTHRENFILPFFTFTFILVLVALSEDFRGLPHSLHANVVIVPRLSHVVVENLVDFWIWQLKVIGRNELDCAKTTS